MDTPATVLAEALCLNTKRNRCHRYATQIVMELREYIPSSCTNAAISELAYKFEKADVQITTDQDRHMVEMKAND